MEVEREKKVGGGVGKNKSQSQKQKSKPGSGEGSRISNSEWVKKELRETSSDGVSNAKRARKKRVRSSEFGLAKGSEMHEQKSGTDERCSAAHVEDTRPCVGAADAVVVIDRAGGETAACVLHGAVLLASLVDGRVHQGSEKGAAIAAYYLAQELAPFAWRGEQISEKAAELRARYVTGSELGGVDAFAARVEARADGAEDDEDDQAWMRNELDEQYLRGLADGEAVERGTLSGYDVTLFGLPSYTRGLSEGRAKVIDERLLAGMLTERRGEPLWGRLDDEEACPSCGARDWSVLRQLRDAHQVAEERECGRCGASWFTDWREDEDQADVNEMASRVISPDDLYAVEFTGGWTAWGEDRPAADAGARAEQAGRIAAHVAAQGRWAIVRYRGQVLAAAGELPKKYAHLRTAE